MRGSLQEQLLQTGIATEEQLKKAKPKPRNNSGSKSRSGSKSGIKPNIKPELKPGLKNRPADKRVKPSQPAQSKTGKKAEEPQSLGKALRTEIKQLLKANKLNDKAGEIPYNYVIAGQVKRFYINDKQQTELKAGKLVIVNWNTISYLISTEAEIELRKIHPTIEVASVENQPAESIETKDLADPYSDFEVPDDLTW